MSLCSITHGYTQSCKSIGGLKKIYVGEISNNVIYNYDNHNQISSITNIQPYYPIEVQIETASFLQTGVFSNENGTAFYTKVIEFTLHGMNQDLVDFIKILGVGGWSIIFQDQSDQYWLLDPKNRVNVTNSTPQLGKAYGDLNGSVITMETKGPKPATIISSGFICNGFNIAYQDEYTGEQGSGDGYTPGVYTLNLRTLSNNNSLYNDSNINSIYNLPSWASGTIVLTIGAMSGYQSIICTSINITNNYGIGTFYISLSETGIPFDNYQDSVVLGSI